MNVRRTSIVRSLLLLVLAALPGCSFNYTRSHCAAQVATPTGPIAVECTADCPASIASSLNGNLPKVTYSFGDNRQIVIEEKRILVDGKPSREVPPGTKKLTIDVKQDQITIQADGQTLPQQGDLSPEKEIQ